MGPGKSVDGRVETHVQQLDALDTRLREFAKSAPAAEAEARVVLSSIPYVGPVTIDAVVSELGDVRRLRSQTRAAAYSGLVPGQRESAGRKRDTGMTKEGSRILRWALVETAWRGNAWKPDTAYGCGMAHWVFFRTFRP